LKRITKAALGGLAGCALVLGATQAANGESAVDYYNPPGLPLVPLQSGSPFEEAFVGDEVYVKLRIKEAPNASNFKLTVGGIDTKKANSVHGAHLHVGGCLEGASGTGGHYKHGDQSAEATRENEVWFDLVPNDSGEATDSSTVEFVPLDKVHTPGLMSIVIHAQSAATPVADSPKLVCIPLDVSSAPNWMELI